QFLKSTKKILRAQHPLSAVGQVLHCDENCDGRSVVRDCSYCCNSIMTYVTVQLRPADEDQIVSYTCTECKQGEIENTKVYLRVSTVSSSALNLERLSGIG
ncbi:unnamed protein product, partial [Hymenolepis diminuta]